LIAISLQEGDELDWVTPTTGSTKLIIATELGKAIRFGETRSAPWARHAGRDRIKGKGDAVAAWRQRSRR